MKVKVEEILARMSEGKIEIWAGVIPAYYGLAKCKANLESLLEGLKEIQEARALKRALAEVGIHIPNKPETLYGSRINITVYPLKGGYTVIHAGGLGTLRDIEALLTRAISRQRREIEKLGQTVELPTAVK